MEEILKKMQKDASGNKHKAIREACGLAYETLEAQNGSTDIKPCQLRDRCLVPLKLALESKNMKLAQNALTGMQKLLSEERFISMETDAAEKQLLNQMLDAVKITPSLHEDLQVEVMKILLCITYSSNFEMNRDSILKIAELCLACHIPGSLRMHEMIKISITQILSSLCRRVFVDANPKTSISQKVCTETYMSSCHQRSINTAVRATLSQMLSDLTLQLRQRQENVTASGQEESLPTCRQKDALATEESLCEDIVSVLSVFCEKLQGVINENKQLQLLYLECILSMLSSCPPSMHLHKGFTDLIWKQLCPALIVILGNPMNDKTITSAHGGVLQEMDTSSLGLSDHGRGSGCSSSAPTLIGPVARTIYCIATELVRLVSCVESMKPVLQSLYHRILLYPPPQHRVEAIKIMKEILSSSRRLFDVAGPVVSEPETRKRSFSKRKSHLDLLKLIMDGMTEACMKGGIEACFSSVSCVCSLLGALDELSQGKGLQPEQVNLLMRRLEELKDGAESTRESMEINEADFRWQRHVLSSEHTPWEPSNERSPDISISVTTDTGQTTLEGDLGQTTPEENMDEPRAILPSPCGQDNGEISSREAELETNEQPDVIQRSHALVYPDITNFLSVECRARSHGSRYSESNFSVDEQDLSRTEFDSCDQYSMAAEKDSGRSDVSDMGSDNCSLADEEQTPRDCPGHRSLRTAALSLKLLKNQEADQHSARLFVQSLVNLLPRLLSLQSTTEVDSSLQNFSSTFCLGLQVGGMHSPGFEASNDLSCQALMNADGLYLVSYYAILLNLKLCCCDYYRKKPAPVLVSLKEFVRQIQSSGVLVVLSQAWIEELYHQVLDRNLLGEAGYWGTAEQHSLPLITMLTDIDGLGSSAIGGQLIHKASMQSPLSHDKSADDSLIAGVVFARYILIGCWKNLIDTLSTPLTGRMAGSSKGLVFILGAEGLKEQNQKERDTICLSLDGLRKAAGLSCALGVAANCASALAQMAAASCVQEDKDDKEAPEFSDTISQVKQKVEQKLEQMGRPQGVRLHTAHVLCMDAILNVGLEMGSHNQDCWPHVFRVCEYVSTLEHSHFSDGSTQPAVTITQAQQGVEIALELRQDNSLEQDLTLSHPVIQPLSIQELLKETSKGKVFDFRGGSLLSGSSAAKAVCTLSTQADRLFEDAANKLNLSALVGFLHQLRKASQAQLFNSVTEMGAYSLAMPGEAKSTQDHASALHLFRLGDVMLRIVRSKSRPLLHMMRAWSVVAPHLVEAACHKERHVSQKAVSFIHDVLTEVLCTWSELPHFHFNEALFRPFEHIMQLELCDEDVQDQVITSIGELVEVCSPQIKSGWRPLFSALRTVHGNKTDVKDYLVGEYSMGKCQAPVFDVFEAFISTDNIQVFANAATDYIMCLMKFVKGLGEVDCKEIGDCVHGSGYSSTDLCLPALDYLRRCSQLLAKIYKMPSKPIFLSARLASLPMKVQERSSSSEDGVESILAEFDDDTGLIQVWILLLEQLTAAVSNCPRQHQPPTLDLLFELLREVTKTPGPGFAIFSVIQLLLPVMSLWLQRSRGDHSYWDVAASNFKHAIGLSCELVVEHIHSFIHSDIGYESMINLMLKDLFKLLVACVAEPTETISRVGCSCIRYVLVTAGPVFTEEMWRLSCCALQDAFSATLEPVKNLLACFHSGSDSFSGDACEVKVAAPSHSATAEAEYWRIRAMAQQVFMLDTQCSPKTPNSKEGFEHAQSCVLIIELPADEKTNGHTQKRIPFRTIVVSLLSHQVLLQNLYDILLEEFVKSSFQAEPQEKSTPVSETKPAGFLKYISMQNLAIIFDLLLDSYRTARDFDTRPGLKYLLMKVSGVCGAANLYRQSAMSFNIYFQALICATLTSQENITAEQVKKILYEEEEGSTDSSQQCSSEDEDIFEETAQVSPPRGKEKRQWRAKIPSLSIQPIGNADWAWLVKRLHKLCMDLCTNYIQMHLDLESNMDEPPVLKADTIFFLPLFPSETSTPSTGGLSRKATPSEESIRNQVVETPAEESPTSGLSTGCLPPLTHKLEKREQGKKKEWWESAGNKLYTIATDKTISKLMVEYKKRKQQHNLTTFVKESKHDKKGDLVTLRGPDPPVPQRPQQLVDQGQMRHSFSAGPEVLRQEKRPRSGSMASSQNISLRDAEAQIQAWTNMVLTILNQIQLLPDPAFVALLPAVFPCISQLTCHVTDIRVRQAVREWLGRLGRVYDIIL
ncbi:brefeldin A-inhibited guanine nucleotide-exchange protein 3-like isoform X1 [Acipenser oxyrinchus oxyrinchus]|uniref:Brefeldin A-inhibited guanine nucleotide-exchange protein 3-like isoform X1 n=1 Tax=Acipenser oxyrinchus oxyrinchus TaxID=40147 RepID=A0AAD8GA52_ACIOX|nr:brefeldin A-inhibited guanine nucleotide-exchange protein 3-like isoform X1 [Acipenser oxyrinchus oxyrinchus]